MLAMINELLGCCLGQPRQAQVVQRCPVLFIAACRHWWPPPTLASHVIPLLFLFLFLAGVPFQGDGRETHATRNYFSKKTRPIPLTGRRLPKPSALFLFFFSCFRLPLIPPPPSRHPPSS